jgi:A/G-specific adenine glycosylase
MSDFANRLIAWQQRFGRHGLPWQGTRDPYRVWLSEIMLQQTQVATVIPYYQRFLQRFPTLADLAAAPVAEVMPYWAGLGYYARARNLHACARAVVEQHNGRFPRDPAQIAELPGIGRSTANAIASFCFDIHVPILDGNVKRVLTRCFGIDGFPGTSAVEQALWALAESLLPSSNIATYTQAQMDMGATVCTRSKPLCGNCPLADICVAKRDERQADLPQKKPKKAVPKRSQRYLVLRHADEVLLEQRPASGIWGGMLSLPELDERESATTSAVMRFGCRVEDMGQAFELNAINHVFSHFQLTLTPLEVIIHKKPSLVQEATMQWLPLTQIEQAALPAPIKKILLGL